MAPIYRRTLTSAELKGGVQLNRKSLESIRRGQPLRRRIDGLSLDFALRYNLAVAGITIVMSEMDSMA